MGGAMLATEDVTGGVTTMTVVRELAGVVPEPKTLHVDATEAERCVLV